METLSDALGWVRGNGWELVAGAGLWILMTAITVMAVRYYLIWIPADHFAKGHKPFDMLRNSHPALRWIILIAKNLIGGVLVLVGILMLVTPGPGWFALLLGLAMVNIPGKRALERRIIERPGILSFVNRLRAKANKPPLELSPVLQATHR